ncbi:hypothetical protein [Streptomyces sp. NPDC060035]
MSEGKRQRANEVMNTMLPRASPTAHRPGRSFRSGPAIAKAANRWLRAA